MKKLVTLLLVVALLVPMCLVANADAAQKPFQAVTWGKDISGYSNVENLYRINISMVGSFVNFGGLIYGQYTDEQVTNLAERMKKDLNARPEGQRYIHFFGPSHAMELIEHAVYMDEAETQLVEMASALFAKYKEIGGQVEGAMMSMLYPDMSAYYVTQALGSDSKLLGKIVKDPRYQTQIRPLLEERGFTFYQGNLTDYTPEIYGITGKAGSQYSNCDSIWSAVMKNRLNAFIAAWAYEPMAKYFPDVHVSDYQSTDTDARLKPISTSGGVMGGGGNINRAGNTSSDKYYSNTPKNDDFYGKVGVSYKNLPTYMGTHYHETSFNNFKFDMLTAKQAYWSDNDHAVSYWVNAYKTSADNNSQVGNSPYYAEQVYHLILHDPKPFVLFTGDDLSGDSLNKAVSIANDLMGEVNRLVGYADRKAIGTAIDWNSEFVLSGMYANGKNYWRITPNRDVVSKEAFKVAGSDPTFYVNGQTVTFPGGKIIADTVSSVPTYGYWVETASNVTPVIKSDADRFAKYPAYIENFESYAVGAKLQSATVQDLNAWNLQAKGGDFVVTGANGGKALSITGNSKMENKQVPANITVADSYAKEQSWEITVTIPAGMASDAQIVLLNYKADGTDVDDGGFLIKGGKLYYASGEEDENYDHIYRELMDLQPGTYTLKRQMHFGQTFYCDYSVLSGGTVLTAAEKVKIPTFSGKVQSINIKCSDMNVNLLLDDYILRATSAAADLSLYTTDLGLKRDTAATQTTSVDYRLSWANASDKVETATVKAVIGNSTQVIKAVTLNPGCDGVEYGTVTLAAGQTAKVYLETSIKDEVVQLPVATQPTQPAETTPVVTQPVETTPVVTQPVATTPVATLPGIQVPTQATQPTVSRPATIVITLPNLATVPAATVPVATTPVVTTPVATVPVATQPVETMPAGTLPVQTVPVATQPVVTIPAATVPAATVPVATVPVQTQPVETTPAETLPVQTQPVATTPAETLPAQTQPAETQPGVTVPVATQPAATMPVVTRPVISQPGVTVPAATRPVATAPAETQSTRPGQTEATRATRPAEIETTPVVDSTTPTNTLSDMPVATAPAETQAPGATDMTQAPAATDVTGITDATYVPGATDVTEITGITDATLAPTDVTEATQAIDATQTTEETLSTQATQPTLQEDKVEKKGPGAAQIIVIILAVLAVAGGGVAAWYFLIYKKQTNTPIEETDEPEEAEETEA